MPFPAGQALCRVAHSEGDQNDAEEVPEDHEDGDDQCEPTERACQDPHPYPPSFTGHGAVARTGFSMARWRSMARPSATTALARLAAFSGERSAYVGSVVNAK